MPDEGTTAESAENDSRESTNDNDEQIEPSGYPEYIEKLQAQLEEAKAKYDADVNPLQSEVEKLRKEHEDLKKFKDRALVAGQKLTRKGFNFEDEVNNEVHIEYNEDGSIARSSYRPPVIIRGKASDTSPDESKQTPAETKDGNKVSPNKLAL